MTLSDLKKKHRFEMWEFVEKHHSPLVKEIVGDKTTPYMLFVHLWRENDCSENEEKILLVSLNEHKNIKEKRILKDRYKDNLESDLMLIEKLISKVEWLEHTDLEQTEWI